MVISECDQQKFVHSNGDAGELLSELVDKIHSVEKESRRGGYPDI